MAIGLIFRSIPLAMLRCHGSSREGGARVQQGERIIMDSLEQDHDGNAGLGGGHSLFLSLYLLLLAFFIALVSVSIPEQPRAQAVVDSLTKTFSRFALARTDGMISERDAQAAAAGRFVAEAGALFQADLPGAQASRLAGGEVLDVILRADLFVQAERGRPDRGALGVS
ncbi:hypothetical protein Rru_A2835 [Rhodospirillum rubrum ATCC 11170]|uniref:Motility protein B-like N-terminal domain-containing protein n=2 Tax=Rhodospirillum rubrum TaxID=1085 RepID=Q2RQG3_RHORT|nr:hypothetical protein Rru_A2835 [Rhodospirillum rubrum ATCC 11170]